MSGVKKNFAYQSAYQILKMILPLITAPYIARVLGRENVGIYSYTYTIANYFVVFAMLGLEQYGSRCIAKCRDNRDERDIVFSELLTVHFFVSVLTLLIYIVYAVFFSGDYKTYLLIQGLFVGSAVFDVNWFFFGIEKFRITVIRNTAIKLITVACIFAFVHDKSDLWKYVLISSAGVLISQIILWRYIPKYARYRHVLVKKCIGHLKPLLLLFAAVVAAHIYRAIDKLMLGWFNQLGDLGCYEYADKLIRMPLSIITALGTVMLSRMSHLFAKNDKRNASKLLDSSALFVVFISFAMAFGLAGIAPEFIPVFLGEEYVEGIYLLMILAITIPLIGWNNFVRTQLLIPMQKDIVYTKAVTAGALVNVLVNIVLIHFYSARGAAIATIISYTVVLIIQTSSVAKETSVLRYLKSAIHPFFIGLIMFFTVRIVGHLLGNKTFTIIIEIIVGVIIYGLFTIIYVKNSKPDMYNNYKAAIMYKISRK